MKFKSLAETFKSLAIKFNSTAMSFSLISLLAATQNVHAKFAYPEIVKVPVQRLLSNLQKRLDDPALKLGRQEKAELEFRIGRLHSMAYALKTSTAQVRKSDTQALADGDGTIEPFYGVGVSDFRQFEVDKTTGNGAERTHLTAAIKHLQAAVKLDPSMLQAKLGLAWCLDQNGDKSAALPLYREVFKDASEREQTRNGLMGTSIASETAGYLTKLLSPTKDSVEIAAIENKVKTIDSHFRTVTPIVIPLAPNLRMQELLQPASVSFDLDGNGAKHYDRWLGARAGWLVYDADHSKQITSGLQLFGPSSFWIFWNDGYEAMKALDDNNDGKLSGTELIGLAVWCDTNGDGKSDPGEVRSLNELGITSLSCNGHLNPNGTVCSVNGVTFADGRHGDTYDVVLQQVK